MAHLFCNCGFFFTLLRPTVDLIGAMETQSELSELELDDVVITNPHIEAILENEDWLEDASYVKLTAMFLSPSLVYRSHLTIYFIQQWFSLSLHLYFKGNCFFLYSLCKKMVIDSFNILQICHTLTEKLVAMTMGSGAKVKAPASLSDIITVAKRISPR